MHKNWFGLPLIALLLAGCGTTKQTVLDGTSRGPKASVDIFDINQARPKKYKEIAELSFLGSRADESKASRYFVKEAKRLGADGLIIYTAGDGYTKGGRLGFGPEFVFKASAIVYER